jgi:hypothetical protein
MVVTVVGGMQPLNVSADLRSQLSDELKDFCGAQSLTTFASKGTDEGVVGFSCCWAE